MAQISAKRPPPSAILSATKSSAGSKMAQVGPVAHPATMPQQKKSPLATGERRA